MIRAGVTGAAGRMGSLIIRGVVESEDMEIAGALEAPNHPCVGSDVGAVIGGGQRGVKISDALEAAFETTDVIIDFTFPEATVKTARYAAFAGKAMVIGTTGFTDGEADEIRSCAQYIPIVAAPNMSIGVNVMFKVVSLLASLLGEDYDVEIVESHHRLKKDAPSGTAMGLARAVAQVRGEDIRALARYERHGMIGPRPKGEIGIQTIRAGDIVGDHTVYFAGNNERIEITHRAHTRQNFAQGAIRAARWVQGKAPGMYSMMDVLGLEP
ncbi:MAG: 4-hydroxy-tetrahydrodipicolinate reductase [Desulfomonilia bacterium]|jgi:4-hydroxy-tetrahydrodipicolinate reductase|nr:4-hydroxy-tetrahydrodipicolinate reductase [Deltaproteobacteria bacterium]